MKLPAALRPFLKERDHGVVTLTTKDVTTLATLFMAPFQRELDDQHVAELARSREDGDWVAWPTIILVIHKNDEPTVIDGHHRLEAHIELSRRANASVSIDYMVMVERRMPAREAYTRIDAIT